MQAGDNFKKIRRTINVFVGVQLALMAMLVYMAVLFQEKLRLLGKSHQFMNAVLITAVVQLAIFYPINKFAAKEAERDLAMVGGGSGAEDFKTLTKKKRYGDIIKGAFMCFFAMFIVQAPGHPLVLSILYFSFILTIITYLQCYNFAAKRLMK